MLPFKALEIYIGERMPRGTTEKGGEVGWRVGFETFRTAKGSTGEDDDDDGCRCWNCSLSLYALVRVELWDPGGGSNTREQGLLVVSTAKRKRESVCIFDCCNETI